MRVCVHAGGTRTHARTHTHTQTLSHTSSSTPLSDTHRHTHTHAHTHAHTHTHACTHTHTHTHTQAQAHTRWLAASGSSARPRRSGLVRKNSASLAWAVCKVHYRADMWHCLCVAHNHWPTKCLLSWQIMVVAKERGSFLSVCCLQDTDYRAHTSEYRK